MAEVKLVENFIEQRPQLRFQRPVILTRIPKGGNGPEEGESGRREPGREQTD